MKISQREKDILLDMVRDYCADDPSLFHSVIDFALAGVKIFADSQTDRAGRLEAELFSVLESTSSFPEKFGLFSRKDIIDSLERCFGGTPGFQKLKDKLGISK